MFCTFCGKQIGDQSKFCPFCGKAVPAAAPNPEPPAQDAASAPVTHASAPEAKAPDVPAPDSAISVSTADFSGQQPESSVPPLTASAPPDVSAEASPAHAEVPRKKTKKEKKSPKEKNAPLSPSDGGASEVSADSARRKPGTGTLLLTACLCTELLPYLLCALLMLALRKTLSVPVYVICMVLGYAAAGGILTFGSKQRGGTAPLPAALLFMSLLALPRAADPFLLTVTESGITRGAFLAYAGELLMWITAAIFIRSPLRTLLITDGRKHDGRFSALLWSLLALAVRTLLESVLFLLPFENTPSFLSAASLRILTALLEAGCFTMAVRTMNLRQKEQPAKAPAQKLSLIAGGVCSAAAAVLLVLSSGTPNVLEMASNDIVYPLMQATMLFDTGDMTVAKDYFNLLGEHANAWSTLAAGNAYDLPQNYASDKMLRYLSFVNGNCETTKNYMVTEFDTDDIGMFGPLMLDFYQTRTSLNEQEKEHRREVLDLCIGSGIFVNCYPTMKTIESYSGELADLSSTDSAYSKYLRLADILSGVQRGEASTSGAIQNLLELAEAYPQDIRIQAIAAIIGSENKWDGASHYNRTSEAVLRFIRCAEEMPELFGEDSATAIIGLRNTAADMLMNIKEYEKARDVLKETLEKTAADKSARQMLARCYMELGEGEESRKLAKEISDADPNDVSALWTLCVCSLKGGDSKEAIEAAGKLADAVKNGKPEGDSLLFNCVSELTINDSSAHYTHSVYTDNPDDENVKRIEAHELLNHYCAAVYYEKEKRDYEQALAHVNKALEVLPQSSRLLYLKGLICFNMEDFPKSEEALLKADALDPNDLSIMYALANTYDGMEEYKKAYDYCERLIAKYPNGADHDEDVYGAMPHAQMLMNRLKSYVEEGS